MIIHLLRSLLGARNRCLTFFRLIKPRILGLRTGGKVQVGRAIQWPLGNVQRMQIGAGVSLGKRGWFYMPLTNATAQIEVGAGTAIGDDFVISANSSISVGRDCLLSYRVTIVDHFHVIGPGIAPVRSGVTDGKPVQIGDKCFIGCGAAIMPGVTLGENCVVGANSVVTKSFEAGSVVAGAPARLVRKLGPTNS